MSGAPPEIAAAVGTDPARATLTDPPSIAPSPSPGPDMESVEAALRSSTLVQVKATLQALVALLDDPKMAVRALHLIVEAAQNCQQMLTVLGLTGPVKKHKLGNYLPVVDGGLLGSVASDEQGLVDVGASPDMLPGSETFAGQAFGQILAMAKQFMDKKAEKPSQPLPVCNGLEVESLTCALRDAKAASLDQDVIDGIDARLKVAIATGFAADLAPGAPVPSAGEE